MNGIFSGTPCQSAIRLMVGTHLLLLVQSSLVLCSSPDLGGNRALIWLTLVLGFSAFICAVRGEGRQVSRREWWRRRHGR